MNSRSVFDIEKNRKDKKFCWARHLVTTMMNHSRDENNSFTNGGRHCKEECRQTWDDRGKHTLAELETKNNKIKKKCNVPCFYNGLKI